MPFAIQLFFDPQTEQTIQAVWQKMAAAGVAQYMAASGNRPHISLALCEELDCDATRERLHDWIATIHPLPVSFQQLGIFPAPNLALFLGPVVTVELLALQRQVDEMLCDCCDWPQFDHYRPGHWIPHCTLAMEFDGSLLPKALEIAGRLELPLNGMTSGIGVIEFRPVKQLYTFPFEQSS